MSEFTDGVLEGMGPAFVGRAGPLLRSLVEALSVNYDTLEELTRETAGGWPALFDVDETPDPAWLARITGNPVPHGTSPEGVREIIRGRATWRRGTPAAMLSAARGVFPGFVVLVERAGSPWQTVIRMYAAEATSADQARVLAAVSAHKPVGVVLTVEIVSGASYAHLIEEAPTYADLAALYPTYAQMRAHIPEEGTTP